MCHTGETTGGARPAPVRRAGAGVRSYTGTNRIIFQAYPTPGTTSVIFTGQGSSLYGILLSGKSYIKIDGFTFQNLTGSPPRWAAIGNSSHHNEVLHCEFIGNGDTTAFVGFWITGSCGDGNYTCHSTHNWIHDNKFHESGYAACGEGGDLIDIGSGSTNDKHSNNNTIENNIFYHAGHTLSDDYCANNVWRNNIGHNEGWKTNPGGCVYTPDPAGNYPGNNKFGHRCFAISSDDGTVDKHNLFEGNRAGYASINPANNGADGLSLGSPDNIIRYNAFFGGDGVGIFFKAYAGANNNGARNRVYNNTFYSNGRWTGSTSNGNPPLTVGMEIQLSTTGLRIKNNLLRSNRGGDFVCAGTGCSYGDSTFAANWCDSLDSNTGCVATGDPKFINPDITDMTSLTLPNLNLQSTSTAIDAGTYLTTAMEKGTNSTTLKVADALYFQAGSAAATTPMGSSLSNVQADWIAIGNVGNVVQISSIDYTTNMITLASPMTWSNGASIWLYKKSDGKRVLHGSAPDIGAYEYQK